MLLPYQSWLNKALRRVVHTALTHAAEKGLEGSSHAFYITFKTQAPAVVLPDFLRLTYPEEMTILLQDNFFNLVAEDAFFQVTLSFQGAYHALTIPYSALVSFIDPSVDFGVRFDEEAKNKFKVHSFNSKPVVSCLLQTKSMKESTPDTSDSQDAKKEGAKILSFKRPPRSV